ncbi:hypothetical protein EYF80_059858 [Liparis tanakae]|uniref:Uncharacterized protein n=1 Tax=Liparis tanakae TaxID=230148 RepID=A0A4Z2EN29_9TELE|nr:hypothetical protein EYF80_059858 [Liparis tanakae]
MNTNRCVPNLFRRPLPSPVLAGAALFYFFSSSSLHNTVSVSVIYDTGTLCPPGVLQPDPGGLAQRKRNQTERWPCGMRMKALSPQLSSCDS